MDEKLMTIINSEIEWRRHLMEEVREIKANQEELKEMVYISKISVENVKTKISIISAVVAIFFTSIVEFFSRKI